MFLVTKGSRVIEKYKDEIVLDADWMEEDEVAPRQSSVILSPLPTNIQELNSVTKKALIRGLIKDLNLNWSSPKPAWWPDEIPFTNITTPPQTSLPLQKASQVAT